MRYYQAVILLLVVFAVLTGVQTYLQSVDPAAIPEDLLPFWNGLEYIFLTSAAAPLFIFLRNILGYAENYLEASPTEKEQISYEAGKLGATWMKYETMIKGYTAMALALTLDTPVAPYAVYIAGALALVTDLITKALKDLKAQPIPAE